MRLLLHVVAFLSIIHASFGKDIPIADDFVVSLPDTAEEQIRSQHPDEYPAAILPKYGGDSFQLFMYRWPEVKASVSLNKIPEQWTKGKPWTSVSGITEGSTDSGIPYVTFNTRITREGRPPFDSVMTVLRARTGDCYMFQMTGDTKTTNEIRESIRNK